MYIPANTLDDLMNKVLGELLERPFNVEATREGKMSEMIGVMLCLTNPRARLSKTETRGKPFSALGELMWYLSKKNNLDFIAYYISEYSKETDDGKTIYGGYGPRLFNMHGGIDQINNVVNLLKTKKTSRRAAIQIFDANDNVEYHKDIPCTCTLQFLLRDNLLHMVSYMRSNDAFLGLPHDVFSFTMLQEIVARTLNVEVGEYKHSVGSLHLYEQNERSAREYLSEGFQATKSPMPAMPKNDPWTSVQSILEIEDEIRVKNRRDISNLELEPFWYDLVRMLCIYSLFKDKNYTLIKEIMNQFSTPIYKSYIERRLTLLGQL